MPRIEIERKEDRKVLESLQRNGLGEVRTPTAEVRECMGAIEENLIAFHEAHNLGLGDNYKEIIARALSVAIPNRKLYIQSQSTQKESAA